jgi:hypothetical protein
MSISRTRERTIHRAVQGYRNQQSWSALSTRLSELRVRGEPPRAIAAILDREEFRPPKRASGFTAGMVRPLLHEMGLQARVVPRGGSFADKPSLAAATCHFLCHPEKPVEFLSTRI